MMKNEIILSILLALGFAIVADAQPKQPTMRSVKTVANKTATVEGSLKDGIKLGDLSWAWNSSNACFPATQQAKFTGNHVFLVAKLPSRSIMTVTVVPKKSGVNLSLYGYQIAEGQTTLPGLFIRASHARLITNGTIQNAEKRRAMSGR